MDTTVLIAEDIPQLCELSRDSLTQSGYRVLTAAGGVECLSIIRHESPAILVASVDLLWGGVDGLLECLRAESRWRTLPAVLLTGCAAAANIAALFELPCSYRYLRKPFSMDELLDSVRAIESRFADLEQLECLIRRDFAMRVHNFRLHACDKGLVLEGRTKTYYGKQLVQHALMDDTDCPIHANNIVVG